LNKPISQEIQNKNKRKQSPLYRQEKRQLKKLKVVKSRKNSRNSIKNNNLYKRKLKKSNSQQISQVTKKDLVSMLDQNKILQYDTVKNGSNFRGIHTNNLSKNSLFDLR